MLPVRVSTLGPICIRPPLPVMVCEKVAAVERSKASNPLSATPLVLPTEPVVPPLPICKVPALIVVCPV